MPGDELRVVCSACESVGTTDPTILPARKVVLALAFDPLLVGYPVSLLRRIRALQPRFARLGAKFALLALPCSDNLMAQ